MIGPTPIHSLIRTANIYMSSAYISDFFNNPGKLYNGGNVATLAVVVVPFTISAVSAAFRGDMSQLDWKSVVTISNGLFVATKAIFYYSGDLYDRAYQHGQMVDGTYVPDIKLNRKGHFWSSVGAATLGWGLAELGDTASLLMAATSGALHALGKFGSFATETTVESFTSAKKAIWPSVYKDAVIVSRIPAAIDLAWNIGEKFYNLPIPEAAQQSVPMFILAASYGVWTRADCLLTKDKSFLLPVLSDMRNKYIKPTLAALGL